MAQLPDREREKLIAELEKLLREEIALYGTYRDLLDKERTQLTKFDSEKVTLVVESRESVVNRIRELQVRRLQIACIISGTPTEDTATAKKRRGQGQTEPPRLSDAIERFCDKRQQARLMPLVAELKKGVEEARRGTQQANQLTSFALNIVNGLMTNIWSATENVVQTYTPNGAKRTSVNPSGDRNKNVRKQA